MSSLSPRVTDEVRRSRFCFLDLCEYASILPLMKEEDIGFNFDEPAVTIPDRFQQDIAGPARLFYYLTDGLIFLILVLVGSSLSSPKHGSERRYWGIAKIFSLTAPFMLLVLCLAYIGYLCEFISSMLRDGSRRGYLGVILRIDMACSGLVLTLSCLVLICAVRTALSHHGFHARKVRLWYC